MQSEGRLINERYRLQHLLGEGGAAEVWLAVDERIQRQVAVKVLRPQYAKDAALLQRFQREAEMLAQLNSPYIVQVYDVGQSEGTSFIVMEYVEGQDLRSLLRFEAPLPVERALRLLRDVSAGVGVAHRAGLVHRDLKPANILLSKRGEVKVTDFGIARQVASVGLTEPGTVWGTSHYIAPEQAQGIALSPATDIYSLGVLLFEMLTGKLPFPGDDPVAIAIAHIQQPPPEIQTVNPQVPTGVAQLVERMLAKAPEHRPQDANALVQILDGYLQGSGGATVLQSVVEAPETQPIPVRPEPIVAETPPPPRQRPPRAQTVSQAAPSRSPLVIGGVIAVLALCVALSVAVLQFRNRGSDTATGNLATQTVPVAEASATAPIVVAEPSATVAVPTLSPEAPPTSPPTATEEPTPAPTATTAPIILPEGPNGPNAFAALRDRERKIKVDGNLNDWEGIAAVPVTNAVFGAERWAGLTDLSGRAWFAWDEENLYLAVDRIDDTFVQNTEGFELYRGDAVELWVDADLLGDRDVAEANGDDFQIAFSPGDFDRRRPEGVIYLPVRDEGRNNQLQVRAIPTGAGANYALEARIPWALLGVQPSDGLELGYVVGLNDNDEATISEQQTQVTTSREAPFARPQTFGTLILVP